MRFQAIFSILVLLFLVVPAIQEISAEVTIIIDGDFADWEDVPVLIEDDDDIAEDNGDVKEIRVFSTEDTFYAMLTVYGATDSKDGQRYYYHFLIDADNDHNTGWDNSDYEGTPTGVENPIGADFYVQVGLKDSAANGIEVHFLTAAGGDDSVAADFEWAAHGDSLEVAVPFEMFETLQAIGEIFNVGDTIMIAFFQEGSANDWECDWTESGEHAVGIPFAVEPVGKLPVTWASLKK